MLVVEITFDLDPARIGQIVEMESVDARLLISEGRARQAAPNEDPAEQPAATGRLVIPDTYTPDEMTPAETAARAEELIAGQPTTNDTDESEPVEDPGRFRRLT